MILRALGTFIFSLTVLMMPVLSNAQGVVGGSGPENRITILYDAFGKDPSMRKDWGFSALIEVAGKRILFDTGDNRDIFAANVAAKNVDLTKLDFVVLSHRHGDHMAGLAHVLSVNPTVKIYAPKESFGIYGSSLPSSFYRKAEVLPPDMRVQGDWCRSHGGFRIYTVFIRRCEVESNIHPALWTVAVKRSGHEGLHLCKHWGNRNRSPWSVCTRQHPRDSRSGVFDFGCAARSIGP
jgi:ribonuclease BN (tRNA processing enzyme)